MRVRGRDCTRGDVSDVPLPFIYVVVVSELPYPIPSHQQHGQCAPSSRIYARTAMYPVYSGG
jgi:hypothetical protein